jgi:hypothetical protein
MSLSSTMRFWMDCMSDYYRPQEILVLEAELARSKAYLAACGVPAGIVEGNTALLTELVMKARREAAGRCDVSRVAASQFQRLMLGFDEPIASEAATADAGRDEMIRTPLPVIRGGPPEVVV